jgi:peptidoglycan/xylan/chitin deacetylase (PgdA/CDA1 family)
MTTTHRRNAAQSNGIQAVPGIVTGANDLFLPNRQTVVDTLGTGHSWIPWGPATGINFNDASDGVLASRHISITPPASTTDVAAIRRDGLALDLTQNLLRIYIRCDNPLAINRIRVYLLSTPPSGNFYRKDYRPTTMGDSPILGDDWQVLTVDPLEGTNRGVSGTPNMASVLGVRIDVSSYGDGQTGTVHLGGFTTVPRHHAAFPHGVVSVTFDDNWVDVDTFARPILAKYDQRATLYMIQDQLDVPNRLSGDQVRRLRHLHGWEVAHHATTNARHAATWDALTEAGLEQEFEQGQEWQRAQGFGEAASTAYPLGVYNETVARIAAKYFNSGRGTASSPLGQETAIAPDLGRMRLKSRSLQGGVEVESWGEYYIDPTYDAGGWFIMHGHRLTADTDGPGTVSAAKLDILMGHIAAKGMLVLPVAEVIAKLALV